MGGECGLTHLARWILVRLAQECRPKLATRARVILRAQAAIAGSKLGLITYIQHKVSHKIFSINQCIVRQNWGSTHLRYDMKPRPDPTTIGHHMILNTDNK